MDLITDSGPDCGPSCGSSRGTTMRSTIQPTIRSIIRIMLENKNATDHRQILMEWETPEFRPMHRGKTWYILASIIFALLLIYALASQSLTMAMAFITVAVIFAFVEKKEPRMVNVQITDLGIFYKNNFYPYHEINAFWIVYHPPFVDVLYLRLRKKKHFVNVKIELNQENPADLRNLLMKEIPELEGAQEPTIDILTRLFKLQ